MSFRKLEFTKKWTDSKDFPAIETNETQVRQDMQFLHDEAKEAMNGLIDALESPDGAASLGAYDYNGEVSTVQKALGTLATALREHIDVDDESLTAGDIGLQSELAEQYGLGDQLNPTVHDALDHLAQAERYKDHWWVRQPTQGSVTTMWLGEPFAPPSPNVPAGREYAFAVSGTDGMADDKVLFVASPEMCIDDEGHLSLPDDPDLLIMIDATASEIARDSELLEEISKDLRGTYLGIYDGENDRTRFLYFCEDAVLTRGGGGGSGGGIVNRAPYYFSASKVQEVYTTQGVRTHERLHSPYRETFPDSGVVDGMEYHYMGIPMERLLDMMEKEALQA